MTNQEHALAATSSWRGLVLERLAQICTDRKDDVAVRFGDTTMSYGDLDARASELAAGLTSRGVSVGDLLGLSIERSQNMLISVLGAWKAGAAFIPLEPDYPKMRLKQMIESAGPRLILADDRDRARSQFQGTELVIFDELVTGKGPAPSPAAQIAANDLAYVIFTSGSTGQPKGVGVSHGALANLLIGIQQPLQLRASDTLAAVTTLSFDISILELILPLTQGATVAIADLLAEKQPSHRTSDPAEIGALALWLSAPIAHNVTGAAIPIDGGWTSQ